MKQSLRKSSPATGGQEVARLELAIAAFRDEKWIPDLRGGAAAKLLWLAMFLRNGCQAGELRIDELGMASLIGANDSNRALYGSKGSDGPLERLLKLGAVTRLSATLWHVESPDVVTSALESTAAAAAPDPQKKLRCTEDMHDPPEQEPRPELKLVGDSPRNPPLARGGEGGNCASDSENEKQNSSSPTSSASAIGGFPTESPGLTQGAVERELGEFGLTYAAKLVRNALERGCSLAEILAAKSHAALHGATWTAPATSLLGDKLKQMSPGEPVNANFPPVQANPAADREKEKKERERLARRDRARAMIASMKRNGDDKQEVRRVLTSIGLEEFVGEE